MIGVSFIGTTIAKSSGSAIALTATVGLARVMQAPYLVNPQIRTGIDCGRLT